MMSLRYHASILATRFKHESAGKASMPTAAKLRTANRFYVFGSSAKKGFSTLPKDYFAFHLLHLAIPFTAYLPVVFGCDSHT